MFVPTPRPGLNFFIPDPEYKVTKTPDPGPHHASKNEEFFKPKKVFLSSRKKIGNLVPDTGSGFFPNTGSENAPDPESRSETLIFTKIFPSTASLLTCINHCFGSALVSMQIQI
jgi:hypothetical protein